MTIYAHELHPSQIAVGKLEFSLLCPLRIHAAMNDSHQYLSPELAPTEPGYIDRWVQHLTKQGKWKEIRDGFPYGSGHPEARDSHAEFVYFHPFVRDVLYANRDDVREARSKSRRQGDFSDSRLSDSIINSSLHILKRTDVSHWTIDYSFNQQDRSATFKVTDCWLYLFDTATAVLSIRLEDHVVMSVQSDSTNTESGPLSLAEVMHLQNIVRRMYTPYWSVYSQVKSSANQSAGSALATGAQGAVGSEGAAGVEETADPQDQSRDSAPSQKVLHHTCDNVPRRATLTFSDGTSSVSHFGDFELTASLDESDEASRAVRDFIDRIEKHGDYTIPTGLSLPEETRLAIEAVRRQLQYVESHREPYTTDIWKRLLEPLGSMTSFDPPGQNAPLLRFEQFGDDRCPIMTFVGIKEQLIDGTRPHSGVHPIRLIRAHDWSRLVSADSPLASGSPPYSEGFSSAAATAHLFYDRFWSQHPEIDAQWQSTRWCISGEVFAGVGEADNPVFSKVLLNHFRYHYFALMLIAQFHRSTLLSFQHRLAEKSEELLSKSKRGKYRRFRVDVEAIATDFLRFRTRYWFSEVSNQIQGRELFGMLRSELNLDKLYDETSRDIESAHALLEQRSEAEFSQAATRLAWIGAVLAAAGPFVAFIDKMTQPGAYLADYQNLVWSFSLATVFAFIVAILSAGWLRKELFRSSHTRGLLACAGVFVVTMLLGVLGFFLPSNFSAPGSVEPAKVESATGSASESQLESVVPGFGD